MVTYPPEKMRERFCDNIASQTENLQNRAAIYCPVPSSGGIVAATESWNAAFVSQSVSIRNLSRHVPVAASSKLHNVESRENDCVRLVAPAQVSPRREFTFPSNKGAIFFELASRYDDGETRVLQAKTRTRTCEDVVFRFLSARSGTQAINVELSAYQHATEFLGRVYALASSNVEEATDLVFRFVDDRLSEGDFIVCREILKRVELANLPTTLMRSFLAITFAAKIRLPERASLYDRVFPEMVRQRGYDNAHRLLDALK